MKKISVIIDCDTGLDDAIAFGYALQSEDLNILGVTTCAGNQTIERTTYNTMNVLHLMKRDELPLARGAAKPLERDLRDAGYIHGENGMGTYTFKEAFERPLESETAWDFMHKIIESAEEPIIIIALAPLTNVAKLLTKYPHDAEKIKDVVFMGGSICIGNPTPVSTFNVLCDPEAARIVIKAVKNFTMVSLNVTRKGFIRIEEIDEIKQIDNPVAEMLGEICDFYYQTSGFQNAMDPSLEGLTVHDLVAVYYVTHPEWFGTDQYYADVECKGELTTGFTMVDFQNNLRKSREEQNVTFVHSVEREKMISNYLQAVKNYS